ncbi:restriction endonuclease subunit S [Secundilactobacillus hailunensis]|uniref:Restriction endonuclease subunit S n=1 Tax=Secundilactobacillus hailunensis TaxID=2559923 RepID=A0ABW1T5G8_9LACO|nr:restriction endonuclease subunit S [Secundilactobacillus hailunensis]
MKDNQAKYPQLRFKGFTDPWEERKLGDEVLIVMGQSPNSENYTDNPNDHILVQGNADMKNGHVFPRVWTTQVTKQAEKNDLILSVRAPVGDIGKTDYDVVIGRGVAAIKGNEFIFQNLGKMKSDGYWTRYSTGSTFESINSSDIKEAIISIPRIEEQQKIGSFFKQLDNTIALHQRKLAKLKELKQGYLQKMFPQNGSKFPQLRFSGFADAWEERKLGNLFSVTDTKHATAPTTDKETQFRMIRTSYVRDGRLLVDQTESVTEQTYKQWSERIRLQPGDIVFSREAPIGEVAIIPDNSYHFFLGQRMVALRSTTEVSTDAQFTLATLLAPRFRREVRIRDAASTTVANFGIPDIKKTSIYVPTPTEQNKLGTLIMMISDTIALHQRKLEKLQELKKGYLQKMFC